MRNTNTTIVDFYQGAYGPTIRIDVQDTAWLKLLKNSILRLKSRTVPELDLLGAKGVEKDEIAGLKLILGSFPSLSLASPVQPGEYASFLWTVTMENIAYMISAIDQLLKDNQPGHYYFYEGDGFLLELAYKE